MEISFILYMAFLGCIIILVILKIVTNKTNSEMIDRYYVIPDKPLKYIPKKIHQCIQDKNKISEPFKKNIQNIRDLNPDWEYNLYDDNDIIEYIKRYYSPTMLNYYNKINPKYGAARADFFRYLLIYREGGVYFDIKSGSNRPLDTIIRHDDEYILTYGNCPCQEQFVDDILGEYQQWHIISRPYHPFIKEVINMVIKNIDDYTVDKYGVGKDAVLKVTGPIVYTNAIKSIIDKYPHRLIESNLYIGLVYNNLSSIDMTSHKNLFSSKHYSKIDEPVIL